MILLKGYRNITPNATLMYLYDADTDDIDGACIFYVSMHLYCAKHEKSFVETCDIEKEIVKEVVQTGYPHLIGSQYEYYRRGCENWVSRCASKKLDCCLDSEHQDRVREMTEQLRRFVATLSDEEAAELEARRITSIGVKVHDGENRMHCSRCNNFTDTDKFHDCEGVYDEVRLFAGEVLPRSARRRLQKKYSISLRSGSSSGATMCMANLKDAVYEKIREGEIEISSTLREIIDRKDVI